MVLHSLTTAPCGCSDIAREHHYPQVIERNGADAIEFLNAKLFHEFAEQALEDGRPIILRA